jgi:hypothetical protein
MAVDGTVQLGSNCWSKPLGAQRRVELNVPSAIETSRWQPNHGGDSAVLTPHQIPAEQRGFISMLRG